MVAYLTFFVLQYLGNNVYICIYNFGFPVERESMLKPD